MAIQETSRAARGWRWFVVESARPTRIAAWPGAPWLAVATVCFGAFMGQLDASIVTLTFPALTEQFHAPLAAVEWVSLSYLLTLVALLAAVGRLADVFGRKLVYIYGFVVFTAASVACCFAPTLGALLAFRVAQAIGAAMLQANSVALVVTSVPRTRMRVALGVQAAAQALGLAAGPTLGALLVNGLGWRWVFGINLPIGLIAMTAGHYLLPRSRQLCARGRFDLPGLLLLGVATTAALLALSGVSGLGLAPAAALGLVAAAVAAGWLFLRRERRAAQPLVDLALLRARPVAAGLVGALCGYLVLFGPLVVVPFALAAPGGSAMRAGLVLTALPAGFAVAATLGGSLLPKRWSDLTRGLLGASVSAVALALLAVFPSAPATLAALLAVLGLGLGVFTPANNTTVMAAIPAAGAGVGGGLVNMTRGLGTALGVGVCTLALHLSPADGPRIAFAALAVAALLGAASTRAAG
ncbi:MFS transporter [Solihabitans fulvus]|uniref:MFS transporter n=1 Tax=Solihabitans fulvus TaxID=1892852 RepID=A0A5B2XKL9_9PSEU|nr:MFS transporter [Solihabitans fulvus]KAA2264307.1 MFS transporter [Solihabitans fulvus]